MSNENHKKKKTQDDKKNPFTTSKKKKAARSKEIASKQQSVNQTPGSDTPEKDLAEGELVLHPKDPQVNPLQQPVLKDLVNHIMKNGIPKLQAEYATLAKYKPPNMTREVQNANKKLCRYKDVSCWDQTRIKLVFPLNSQNDFIHANYVNHPLFKNKFICTQGPMEHTVLDFWRLVWQESVTVIIMLCQCFELKKPKCAQYWPTVVHTPKQVGPFSITADDIKTDDPNVTVTDLKLEFGGDVRRVEHYHWVTWPDKTVPKNASIAFRLLVNPRDYTANPSVIHCSAGVGRTGTLLMLEAMFQHIQNFRPVDVPELLKQLRAQRSQLIQTEDQYVFIHYAMVQYAFMTRTVTLNECQKFFAAYSKYLKEFAEETKAKQTAKKKKKKPVKATRRKEHKEDKKEEKKELDTYFSLHNYEDDSSSSDSKK
ncbi:unnamed protein product [Bursaphelenchus okinawaensis]|uniref:Uncharacterized protein n=1 Tax=Bursaphelenchus okinawaensis TaxID=465554 RepID=A0A811LQB0_9BILA|nr:unnamed protein product [Bursaphelenchus okinawaensis]CAG9126160.1 unnamed protein product [Bursaphelenchus okinawaensis]